MAFIYTDLKSYNEDVSDISKSTNDFLWNRHRIFSISISIITLAPLIGTIALLATNSIDPDSGTSLLKFSLFFIVLPISIIQWVTQHMKQLFVTQIAPMLNMTYSETGILPTQGYIFSLGHDRSIRNVFSGTYNNLPLRLYEYTYIVGSGKSRTIHTFTVSEIDVGHTLPHLFMRPKLYPSMGNPPDTKSLSHEGNFNDYFSVFIPADGQIEALQILEPDVMASFVDDFTKYGFETSDTKIYLFKGSSLTENRELLLEQVNLLQRLYGEIVPELENVK